MKKWFALIVGLQVLFLAGQMANYQMRLSSGETLRLRVVPYDPRSLMIEQYMNLRYDISRVDAGKVHGASQARTDAHDLTGRVLYAAMRAVPLSFAAVRTEPHATTCSQPPHASVLSTVLCWSRHPSDRQPSQKHCPNLA